MITEFKAYAYAKDQSVDLGKFPTEAEARSAAHSFERRNRAGNAPFKAFKTGVREFYKITKDEFDSVGRDFAGTSLKDPNQHVIFEGAIPGNHGKGGTTLLFEGVGFAIV